MNLSKKNLLSIGVIFALVFALIMLIDSASASAMLVDARYIESGIIAAVVLLFIFSCCAIITALVGLIMLKKLNNAIAAVLIGFIGTSLIFTIALMALSEYVGFIGAMQLSFCCIALAGLIWGIAIKETAQAANSTAAQQIPAQSASSPATLIDELKKIKSLADNGTITKAEYEAMKARLLGG
ncbi:MAG: SHOCT domain-containing protein [Firmicutes bacterium]|nr:SHOCT domain-containing protein [Bacillota bacterium]